MAYKDKEIEHHIDSDTDGVFLQIGIGDKQSLYDVSVTLANGKTIYGETQIWIGTGASLRGTTTKVVTSVKDDNPLTDICSTLITLTNSVLVEPVSHPADSAYGTVDFYIDINHI
jgi:hypothetical protein